MTDELEERRVLGDALSERGDLAGEVVQLQAGLETLPPEAPAVRRRLIEAKLARVLDQHHDAIFGALAPHVQRASRPDLRYPVLRIDAWRGGFVDAVHLASNASTLSLDAILAILRDLPIARFLRRIDATGDDTAGGVGALAVRPIATLRELVLRRAGGLGPLALAFDDASLAPLFAQLEVLHIHHELHYRRLVAPRLRSLILWQIGYPVAVADPLDYGDEVATGETTTRFVAEAPALEELMLYGFAHDLTIFDRHPRLHTARLYGRFDPGFWDEMFTSPHLARLRVLAFGFQADEAFFESLARNADRVRHLALIDLSSTYFPIELRERYAGRLPACVKL